MMGLAVIFSSLALALGLGFWGRRLFLRRRELKPSWRARMLGVAIALAPILVVALFSLPALRSYAKNREFIEESERINSRVAAIDWDSDAELSEEIAQLEPALARLRELDRLAAEGPPADMRWGMYRADEAYQPALGVYVAQLERGLIEPCRAALAEQIAEDGGNRYLVLRTRLKLYLMLRDFEHLDVSWATARYSLVCSDALQSRGDLSSADLKLRLTPHLQYYFEQLKRGAIAPMQLDDAVVDHARLKLQDVPVDNRFYDMFVNSLGVERIDEAALPTLANALFPPVTVRGIFAGRGGLLSTLRSKQFAATGGYIAVEGPYTEKGRYAVVRQLEGAEGLLASEAWVVPAAWEERRNWRKRLLAVVTRYEEMYIRAWVDFFLDIAVDAPETPAQAAALFDTLTTPPYAYVELLALLEQHTQWPTADPFESDDPAMLEANRRFSARLDEHIRASTGSVALTGLALAKVRNKFANERGTGTVDFARPPQAGQRETSMGAYLDLLRGLRAKVSAAKARPRARGEASFSLLEVEDDFAAAREATRALLSRHDATTNQILGPLLNGPLRQ